MNSWVSAESATDSFSETAKKMFVGDLEFARQLHPRLAMALQYLSVHYLSDLSQVALAERSCVSASHLAFLFRSELKTRFKVLLVELRLLYALSLLREDPRILITDLCLRCGFGDLSHFEKMFRRYMGSAPRDYRRTITAPVPAVPTTSAPAVREPEFRVPEPA